MDQDTVRLVAKFVCAVLLPPLAVALHRGLSNSHFWLNVLLTLFGCWVPGIVHAIYVIAR